MIRKIVGAAAALLFVVVACIVLSLWVQHNQPVTLPALAGPYPVGRTAFDWVDVSRGEELAPETRAKRELTVWMWYPASIDASAMASEYIPAPWRAALAPRQGPLLTNFAEHDTSLVRTHSYDNVEVASAQRTYPVILMKPGIGALALDYSALAEDLASAGYIVVASDSPYSTFVVVFHDGRVAERRPAGNPGDDATPEEMNRVANRLIITWVADDRVVLDRLTELNKSDPSGRFRGRLNLQEVGAFGHSFGGATAAEFCRADRRCSAAIDVDGAPFGKVVQTSLNRPLMFLLSDHSQENDSGKEEIAHDIESIYKRLPRPRLLVTLRDSGHFSFSDKSIVLNRTLVRMSGMAGSIDATRGLAAASACIRAFFDIHLKGASPAIIQELKKQYPELVFANDSKPIASQL